MASVPTASSSSSSSSSTLVPRWIFDVFLSFRGEDTRAGFISHLHHALVRHRINPFIDGNLRRGELISPALIEAIQGSRIAVVVISPNFAASTWCLDELVKILECRESKGQLVRPVFLYVDPSDMRKERGFFATQMAKHEEDFRDDPSKVQRWRLALREAANLSGWHLGNGLESELVQKIVEEVSSKLSRPYLSVAVHPVGLDSHVQAVYDLLFEEDNAICTVGICGISGVGKTAIAKALYNRIADQFQGSSFIADLRETSRQYGLVRLQEAFLHDMLGDPDLKVGYTHIGRKLIREKLHHKRALLVLDDADNLDALDNLIGNREWFGFGSRIVITAREEETLVTLGVKIYRVCELNYDDALQLFCWNAFQKLTPARDYRFLSFGFTSYAKGVPLFLIVLGSYLKGKSVLEWTRTLNRLKAVPQGKSSEVLKISFDGLEAHEKAIFLDIACFFRGEDKHYVIKLLDRCNFHPESGLQILVEKSLISLELDKIWMHDLLQEMGRDIVFHESPDDPGKRSRLWYHEDVLRVIRENSGTHCIEGIKLDMLEPEELLTSSKTIKKMKKLRLLIVRDIHISGCPEYLLNELSWLDVNDSGSSVGSSSSSLMKMPVRGLRSNKINAISSKFKTIKVASRKFLSLVSGPSFRIRHSTDKASKASFKMGKTIASEDLIAAPAFSFAQASEASVKLGKTIASEDLIAAPAFPEIREFSLGELRQATNNFSDRNKIGLGSFGSVYHGILDDGRQVAIKRGIAEPMSKRSLNRQGFIAELNAFSGIHHKNIVKLFGFLEEKNERALVYEYMSNHSLHNQLHDIYDQDSDSLIMSWTGRIKVALDAANGIAYLHYGMRIRLVHRDVKSSNILLDSDFTAKISDLGMSVFADMDDGPIISSHVVGTVGYLDPDYYLHNRVTAKSDVYGFGVVLLELLSGRKAIHRNEDGVPCSLIDSVVPCILNGEIAKILDPKLPNPNPLEMEAVSGLAYLAVECTSMDAKDRPQMSDVESSIYKFFKYVLVTNDGAGFGQL